MCRQMGARPSALPAEPVTNRGSMCPERRPPTSQATDMNR
jgi:hypothetical protein